MVNKDGGIKLYIQRLVTAGDVETDETVNGTTETKKLFVVSLSLSAMNDENSTDKGNVKE